MKKYILLTLFVFLGVPVFVSGARIDSAVNSAENDLKAAVKRLAELRQEIKEQKIPKARELRELEWQLKEKRREVQRITRIEDNATVSLSTLQNKVQARQDQVDYLANLLSEYARSFKIRIDLSEMQYYKSIIDEMDVLENSPELTKAHKLESQLDIVETGLSRFRDLLGGHIQDGRAVTKKGEVVNGKFIYVGPTIFFAGNNGENIGLALNSGSLEPSVIPIGINFEPQITGVANTLKGEIPLDATLGDALAIARTKETIMEHITKGGIWIWPILGFAALAALTALYKLIEIYSVKLPKAGTLHTILKLLDQGEDEKALTFARTVQGPAGKMLIEAVLHADENKELVEEVLYERMLEVQPKLERLLPFIAVTAATAPLMGLLGTVTGMINTFKLITIFGTGDAKSLSSGISEALITTEFGLIVAIPSLILHSLLSRRAQGVMANLERLAVAFVNGLTRQSNNNS